MLRALIACSLPIAAALIAANATLTAAPTRAADGRQPPVARASIWDLFGGDEPSDYALDTEPRFVEPGGLACDQTVMVRYKSRALRYAVTVHPAFAQRLARFDTVLAELAIAHYGRAPRRLLHRGAFACRTLRTRRERISEHALGNALDFQGLDFGGLPRRAQAPADLPRHLRAGFQLRVLSHWNPARERDAHHARFLHQLTDLLSERPDIFRGIVGPPRPRHHDHLHLDAAPWRYAWFSHDAS